MGIYHDNPYYLTLSCRDLYLPATYRLYLNEHSEYQKYGSAFIEIYSERTDVVMFERNRTESEIELSQAPASVFRSFTIFDNVQL